MCKEGDGETHVIREEGGTCTCKGRGRTGYGNLETLDKSNLDPSNRKPKENQPWIFTGRADAKALILWPPDVKSWLIGKDPDAGKDWGQEEKGVTEDEMVGGHHWLSVHDFEQTLGDGEGQGSLACCSPWGCKESDRTEGLNNNTKKPLEV